jgi:hypothetical protein
MAFEQKCQQMSQKLLKAVMQEHVANCLDALSKREYTYPTLNDSNIGKRNFCAVGFIDNDLSEYYLEYPQLPESVRKISTEQNIEGREIAVFFNGGGIEVVGEIGKFIQQMFSDHYVQLFPFQFSGIGMQIPEGRHTDSEERALYALSTQEAKKAINIPPNRGNTMILVSSMDTCQYCALSLAGFLSLDQKTSFFSLVKDSDFFGARTYHLKGIRVYYAFSYNNLREKLELYPKDSVLLFPPHCVHINLPMKFIDIFIKGLGQIKHNDGRISYGGKIWK